MFMSMMSVRPVRMNMIFFTVLMLVRMRFLDDSRVFMRMMHVGVTVQMGMNLFSMQVRV